MMAFMIDGMAPMVPASPQPLTPKGLVGLGVPSVSKPIADGMSSARGTP